MREKDRECCEGKRKGFLPRASSLKSEVTSLCGELDKIHFR